MILTLTDGQVGLLREVCEYVVFPENSPAPKGWCEGSARALLEIIRAPAAGCIHRELLQELREAYGEKLVSTGRPTRERMDRIDAALAHRCVPADYELAHEQEAMYQGGNEQLADGRLLVTLRLKPDDVLRVYRKRGSA